MANDDCDDVNNVAASTTDCDVMNPINNITTTTTTKIINNITDNDIPNSTTITSVTTSTLDDDHKQSLSNSNDKTTATTITTTTTILKVKVAHHIQKHPYCTLHNIGFIIHTFTFTTYILTYLTHHIVLLQMSQTGVYLHTYVFVLFLLTNIKAGRLKKKLELCKGSTIKKSPIFLLRGSFQKNY